MSAYLNLITKIQAFADQTATNNPRLRYVDWLRDMSGLTVDNAQAEAHTIEGEGSKTIFSGTRSTTLDGTTSWSVELSSLSPSRYRFTWTGGTGPTLRTSRSLTLDTEEITFTVNANATLSVSVDAGSTSTLAAVTVGDHIFIPHTTTGDAANVINVANAGFWSVLSKADSRNVVLERLAGEDFNGYSETVTLTENAQFVAFSSSGVQAGDAVTISAGFAIGAKKTFDVDLVTDTWFEVISTTALAEETSIEPGAAGMIFYSDNKQFIYIEADQDCVVRVNGDTGDYQRISPIDASEVNRPGVWMKWGPTWSLSGVNKTAQDLRINVIYAE